MDGEQDERDERDARDAVRLEAVGARPDRVTGVVARAVGNHAGVAGVVFLDLEDDLHEDSEPMSAIFVKIPPRDAQGGGAPSDSPMAKPMKQDPA